MKTAALPKKENGSILVLGALALAAIFAIAALAIDVANAYQIKTKMVNAVGLAARAGAKRFATSYAKNNENLVTTYWDVKRLVEKVIEQNPIGEDYTVSPILMNVTDVVLGTYDYNTNTFDDVPYDQLANSTQLVNAVQVTLTDNLIKAYGPDPFVFHLASALGINLMSNAEVTAIGTYGILNFVILLDISASTDNITYKPPGPPHTPLPVPPACANAMIDPNPSDQISVSDLHQFYFSATTESAANPLPSCFWWFGAGPGEPYHQDRADYLLAIMPEPLTAITRSLDYFYNNSELFSGFYRTGLVAFETTAYASVIDAFDPSHEYYSTEMTPTNLRNRDAVQAHLYYARSFWKSVAEGTFTMDLMRTTLGPEFIWPGGMYYKTDTYSSGGYTNIGDAIKLGTDWITTANQLSKTQAKDVMLLVTDGIANCDGSGSGVPDCGNSPAKQAGGQNYALAQASNAAAEEIMIHGIYFNLDPSVCTGESGYINLKAIVDATGGNTYCVDNADQLTDVLKNLSEEALFVLAPET